MKPLGPTFHRSFPLQRAVLAEYLKAVSDAGRALRTEEIRQVSSLGTMKIPSAMGYGRGTGLLDATGSVNAVGREILENDPRLSQSNTQWLLHAGLCLLSESAPIYWSRLWDLLRVGSDVDRSIVDQQVVSSYPSGYISPDSGRVSATVFISTYLHPECLGELSLLRKVGGNLSSTLPETLPPLGVFAYSVANRWESLHKGQLTSSLDSFMNESRLREIFRISREQVEELLEAMAHRGDIELYRSAPPHQIVRKWNEVSEVIARIYEDVR